MTKAEQTSPEEGATIKMTEFRHNPLLIFDQAESGTDQVITRYSRSVLVVKPYDEKEHADAVLVFREQFSRAFSRHVGEVIDQGQMLRVVCEDKAMDSGGVALVPAPKEMPKSHVASPQGQSPKIPGGKADKGEDVVQSKTILGEIRVLFAEMNVQVASMTEIIDEQKIAALEISRKKLELLLSMARFSLSPSPLHGQLSSYSRIVPMTIRENPVLIDKIHFRFPQEGDSDEIRITMTRRSDSDIGIDPIIPRASDSDLGIEPMEFHECEEALQSLIQTASRHLVTIDEPWDDGEWKCALGFNRQLIGALAKAAAGSSNREGVLGQLEGLDLSQSKRIMLIGEFFDASDTNALLERFGLDNEESIELLFEYLLTKISGQAGERGAIRAQHICAKLDKTAQSMAFVHFKKAFRQLIGEGRFYQALATGVSLAFSLDEAEHPLEIMADEKAIMEKMLLKEKLFYRVPFINWLMAKK